MIREINIDRDNKITTNIVDELSEIDLTKDAVIVFQHKDFKDHNKKIVEYNVDEFLINSAENMRPLGGAAGVHNINFDFFPRVKMSLPNGLFPQFRCLIPGVGIKNSTLDKIQGVELNEELKIGDAVINVTGIKGLYSSYSDIAIRFEQFDHKLFTNDAKFMGHRIPIGEPVIGMRLLPHFIGDWKSMGFRNLYAICGSYIHDRFPNF